MNVLRALIDKVDNMKDWLCKHREGNPKNFFLILEIKNTNKHKKMP